MKWKVVVEFTIEEPKRKLDSVKNEVEQMVDCLLDAVGYPERLTIQAVAIGDIELINV